MSIIVATRVGTRIRIPTNFPSIGEAVQSLTEHFDESFVQCVTIYVELDEVGAILGKIDESKFGKII